MVKAITPFSTRAKEGATDAPLGDFVKVEQEIISTATAGFYDKNTGKLEGVLGSDKLFTLDAVHEAVPNGGAVTSPQGTGNEINMTGFSTLFIALIGSEAGNHAITAVQGGSVSYANLTPPDGGATLQGNIGQRDPQDFTDLFHDGAQSLTADVWNIFTIQNNLADQKTLNFKITNNTGSEEATLQFAYMRVV